jgi:carbon-monoxide dehydrogenase large subunit
MSDQREHAAGKNASGLGAAVPRVEDQRLLTGRGRYVDDVNFPGMTFAYVLRSPHAHAQILGIDTQAALAAPGVLSVLTGEDVVRERLRGIPCGSFPSQAPGSRAHCPEQPILVADKVRHVGDRVALVVAETLAQAKDAAEQIAVDYQPLAAVTLADAARPDAARVWDEADGNTSFELEVGGARQIDEKFTAAFHTSKIRVHYPRASANSIEPRAALAYPAATDGRFTLYTSTQEPFRVRKVVSNILGTPELDLRVVAMDVGGAFGMKGQTYPEEVLVAWAAAKLGRPVKWTADRSEALASDMHGRHQIAEAELAFDRDGHVLAFRTSVDVDVGAYLSHSGGVPPHNAGVSYPGTYRVPLIHATVRALFTNSSQLGPYRGSGKPEASFVLERLIEKAGREMGIDPIDLRRRNLIRPSDMPYQTPGGNVYDCGDFERVLDNALALADWRGFAARRTESDRRGLRRGIGLSMHCQRAGTFSERMEIRVAPNGSAALYTGTLATGQGHETMFAQMASGWLGLRLDEVRVFQGDTDKVLFGRGTFAQRSMSAGGSALRLAADEVIRKGRHFAAWMLEAAEADIVFEDGVFRVSGTDRQVGFRDVARKSYAERGVPQALGIGLDGVGAHEGPNTYPNGCIVCEVEVDPDTGMITVDRLSAVDDVGLAVNPLTLHGQLHGSVAQGLGETLIEQVVYDRDSGQLLTGSFQDYAMPRADIMPDIVTELASVPTKTNLLGVKGGSEAGNVATPAAIVNAVLDALSPWGIEDLSLPATPERVWRAINEATTPATGRT